MNAMYNNKATIIIYESFCQLQDLRPTNSSLSLNPASYYTHNDSFSLYKSSVSFALVKQPYFLCIFFIFEAMDLIRLTW